MVVVMVTPLRPLPAAVGVASAAPLRSHLPPARSLEHVLCEATGAPRESSEVFLLARGVRGTEIELRI